MINNSVLVINGFVSSELLNSKKYNLLGVIVQAHPNKGTFLQLKMLRFKAPLNDL